MAGEVFKILNKISPVYMQDLVIEKITNYDFRFKKQVTVPQVRSTKYGMKSFRYEATQVWNSLPDEISKELSSVQETAAYLGRYQL